MSLFLHNSKIRREHSLTGYQTAEAAVVVLLLKLIEQVGLDVDLELLGHDRHKLDGAVLHEELGQLKGLVIGPFGAASTCTSHWTAACA